MIEEYEIVRQNIGVKLKTKRKIKADEWYNQAERVPYFCRDYLYNANDFVEKSYVVALDLNHQILGIYMVSSGDSLACSFYPRNIVSFLVLIGAYDYILIHNHPWKGACRPSDDDIKATTDISIPLEMIQFHMYDHYIVTDDAFYSIKTCETICFDEEMEA